MGYDEDLAERVRDLLGDEPGYVEKKMFGGLAMLLAGNMACCVMRPGLLVRVDPGRFDELMAEPGTHPFEMGRDRVPRGWVVVDERACADDAALRRWVGIGADVARTLPAR